MITIVQLAGGFALLLFGAEYMVRGAVAPAPVRRVSPMAIGMTGRLDRRAATLFLAAFVAYTGLRCIGVKAVFR